MMDHILNESFLSEGEDSLNLSNSTNLESPDSILQSPLGKSRYGRTRKPKITEDFCDIDDAIESTKSSQNQVRRPTPKTLRSTGKMKSGISTNALETDTKVVPRIPKILHVTGDSIIYDDKREVDIDPYTTVKSPESPLKTRKFFKSSPDGTKQHSATQMYINKTSPSAECNKIDVNSMCIFDTPQIDISQVLKIISSKPGEQKITSSYKGRAMVKTYSNKRKSFNQSHGIIESFGLPDEPIVPLDLEISVKPLRISELDVDATEPVNINLFDKPFIDSIWDMDNSNDAANGRFDLDPYDVRQIPDGTARTITDDKKFEFAEDEKTEDVTNLSQAFLVEDAEDVRTENERKLPSQNSRDSKNVTVKEDFSVNRNDLTASHEDEQKFSETNQKMVILRTDEQTFENNHHKKKQESDDEKTKLEGKQLNQQGKTKENNKTNKNEVRDKQSNRCAEINQDGSEIDSKLSQQEGKRVQDKSKLLNIDVVDRKHLSQKKQTKLDQENTDGNLDRRQKTDTFKNKMGRKQSIQEKAKNHKDENKLDTSRDKKTKYIQYDNKKLIRKHQENHLQDEEKLQHEKHTSLQEKSHENDLQKEKLQQQNNASLQEKTHENDVQNKEKVQQQKNASPQEEWCSKRNGARNSEKIFASTLNANVKKIFAKPKQTNKLTGKQDETTTDRDTEKGTKETQIVDENIKIISNTKEDELNDKSTASTFNLNNSTNEVINRKLHDSEGYDNVVKLTEADSRAKQIELIDDAETSTPLNKSMGESCGITDLSAEMAKKPEKSELEKQVSKSVKINRSSTDVKLESNEPVGVDHGDTVSAKILVDKRAIRRKVSNVDDKNSTVLNDLKARKTPVPYKNMDIVQETLDILHKNVFVHINKAEMEKVNVNTRSKTPNKRLNPATQFETRKEIVLDDKLDEIRHSRQSEDMYHVMTRQKRLLNSVAQLSPHKSLVSEIAEKYSSNITQTEACVPQKRRLRSKSVSPLKSSQRLKNILYGDTENKQVLRAVNENTMNADNNNLRTQKNKELLALALAETKPLRLRRAGKVAEKNEVSTLQLNGKSPEKDSATNGIKRRGKSAGKIDLLQEADDGARNDESENFLDVEEISTSAGRQLRSSLSVINVEVRKNKALKRLPEKSESKHKKIVNDLSVRETSSPKFNRKLRSSLNANSTDEVSHLKSVVSEAEDKINTNVKASSSTVCDTTYKKGEQLPKESSEVTIKHTVPSENEDTKPDAIELQLKPLEIKTEYIEYKPGDLMWAKIGSYPYWPCLVTKEPLSGEFRKDQLRKVIYHVRFFGDNGRRSWIPIRNLIPYIASNDLEILHDKLKTEGKNEAVIMPVKQNARYRYWEIAVAEAESVKGKTIDERFDFFFQMFASKREKKMKLLKEMSEIYKKPAAMARAIKKSKDKLRANLRLSRHVEVTVKKTRSPPKHFAKSQQTRAEVKEEIAGALSDSGFVARKRVTRLTYQKTTLESVRDVPEVVSTGHRKNNTPQRELLGSEYSLSDTDSNSKVSINSPVSFMLEPQITLHKRNNLFRGVPKERVCQICKTSGKVIKCKGRCCGYYHISCANELDNFSRNSSFDSDRDSTLLDMKDLQITSSVRDEAGQSKDEQGDHSMNEVEIIQIRDKRKTGTSPKLMLNRDADFKKLPLLEQIDHKMKEVMEKFEDHMPYADSTTDYTSSEESFPENSVLLVNKIKEASKPAVDTISVNSDSSSGKQSVQKHRKSLKNGSSTSSGSNNDMNDVDFRCSNCLEGIDPVCFDCHKELSKKGSTIRQKCSIFLCGKFYHPECLKLWPQTQWSLILTTKHKDSDKTLDTFVCPGHVCHTCVSDDPRAAISRCPSDKVVKCLRCPATYHATNYCVPAGSEILSSTQIVCPRHLGKNKRKQQTINTTWCFICSEGGDLICCETCPTSVHSECLDINLMEDGTFLCEDCETGRFPLYDEIVWVKLGSYRWWPAVILFPNDVPENIKNLPHNKGEFVVKFFGTHDHYWIGRGRVFLFQEGDTGGQNLSVKKKVDAEFKRSIEEAKEAHRLRKDFKITKEAEIKTGLKPPPYIKIKMNRPVGNVRQFDGNVSNTTPCECDPKKKNPCGPDSDCLNRLLLTECDSDVCPAGEKCMNQNFEKRKYPPLVPYRTQSRGWGLKSSEPIEKGQFVIEYVGEMIDEQEYQRRIAKMHEQKEENYYFLTIDKDRMLDAGPKGNVARFMNHSCQPNCETQKWTVNGDTRVGLFATEDIEPDTELTFNYNLECVGKEKKICKCGAPNCSGFIGLKVKQDESQKKTKKSLNKIKIKKKKRSPTPPSITVNNDPCFVCAKTGNVGACHNKICTKFYHLKCVNLDGWPDNKWACPWHNCNVCSKRTIRCCVKCINSYCPVHSEGNVRYDRLLGFVCSEHDPTKEPQEIQVQNRQKQETVTLKVTEEHDVTSTTCDELDQTATDTDVKAEKFEDDSQLPSTQNLELTPKDGTADAATSTPIKENSARFDEKLDLVASSRKSVGSHLNKKRKRGRPHKFSSTAVHKKLKLEKKGGAKFPVVKLQHPISSLINAFPVQNEVIMSSTVPTRFLRASKVISEDDSDRLLKRHRQYEKDLPIRKRSTLRCETTI